MLVKDLKNEVILGTPFIRALFPLEISDEGISTKHLGKQIVFRFVKKPIIKTLNIIDHKSNHINFLKEEISFKTIQAQLEQPQVQQRIRTLQQHIQSSICSDLPNAFWNRKKHIIDLPYEKDFKESGKTNPDE